jgi:hypothetical protein
MSLETLINSDLDYLIYEKLVNPDDYRRCSMVCKRMYGNVRSPHVVRGIPCLKDVGKDDFDAFFNVNVMANPKYLWSNVIIYKKCTKRNMYLLINHYVDFYQAVYLLNYLMDVS